MSCGATARYLSLLKRCLTRTLFPDQILDWDRRTILPFDPARRADGSDWPTDALTMVGMARLDNLQLCIETALRDGVAGDLMETGVWRGGCGILMRAVLDAHGDRDRQVWLADSFQGQGAWRFWDADRVELSRNEERDLSGGWRPPLQ
jgi:O-methyltransferase